MARSLSRSRSVRARIIQFTVTCSSSHPRSRSSFFVITFVRETSIERKLEFASAPPRHQTPSSAWWSGRALRCDYSSSGASPTGPVSRRPTSRRAAESPSRRAAERASARKTSPPRPHRTQWPFQTHRANAVSRPRRVPPFASSRRPPTHNAWPFVVARATQVFTRSRLQSGSS